MLLQAGTDLESILLEGCPQNLFSTVSDTLDLDLTYCHRFLS